MSAALPSHPVAAMPGPISGTMRIALGFLHTGALYREGNAHWRCRAYPDQPVRDHTVRGMIERGLVRLESYETFYRQRRECVVVTPLGRKAYSGGRFASQSPPPVAAEAILHEVEMALRLLDDESKGLGAELLRQSATVLAARKILAQSEANLNGLESRLAKVERSREALDARRVDLRALVAAASERMAQALSEAQP